MRQLGALVLLSIVLGVTAYAYEKATAEASDPYAQCEAKQTDAERDQCRHLISFAMSAGW